MTQALAEARCDAEPIAEARRRGLTPIDVCIAGYLAASGLLILVRDPGMAGFVPLVVRVLFAITFIALRRYPLPCRGIWGFIRLVYPVAVYPYLYAELAHLNHLVTTTRFDLQVIAWEAALFGSQPSVVLRDWLPWRALSEYLHFGYFSYYFIPTLTATLLWRAGLGRAVNETMTAITVTFATCYTFFVLFPVVGPYHTFIPPDPDLLGNIFPPITHSIVRDGSSPGTAFPSSHVAVATTALLQAMRHHRGVALLLWFLVPALIVGTVYGGFHYAIDALAGLVVAAFGTGVGRAIHSRLEKRRTD